MTAARILTADARLSWEQRDANNPRQTTQACWRCGKPMSGAATAKAWHVHVVDGGSNIIEADALESEHDQAGDLGWYPIGSECARHLPRSFRDRFRDRFQ